ncbi:MAG: hypothetical protein A2487_06470 [Candidatus Raymondbacteria bacterium RifOxyC12_full_50_8]|uniref:ATPase n=1 Tax=Candidatus Raymondbacteria bacterium RIFOXYD12_FULL_49_13 TaxID=1817890 RepID=A0A1F7FI52_UNCRA|nr:MAG: hypothetical protein A2248_21185 [Candidatus Raymondbacteria bacterium RIFOXYA2_FULL_49_16]OGJ95692.1 MAG: hypothetical protein A2350_12185 [Candidatus Raymondbacteria bacterium RifOxyB12_full_50_8]OGK05945.1 MAG: hypothetical protein A2487_06470 [Candidatus Raymondbacteria bacterium RifOxyC12_full_50_8]OGK06303.1 MAG: hypothetical protein A2519_08500 [Candidatus Raymondbacteria bacterium RIFOXYD12_FULL_49_13]OGP40636.1 MAG: hypothetical protein A2324_03255 [Candidatus Raymondbacteria b
MKRGYKQLLDEYLTIFPCVAIIGPRQCGKTTLLSELPKTWKTYDLERQADLSVVSKDPDLFLKLNPFRIAIDEAQICPAVFPALRVAIDAYRKTKGRFIITGSSSPSLLRSVSESLAGRIGIIEMSPFSFAETRQDFTSPFFKALKHGKMQAVRNACMSLRPRSTVNKAHTYWLNGGYPEPWLEKAVSFRLAWMDQYVKTYIERDISRLFPGLDKVKFGLFIQLFSNLSGTIVNYSDVARALGVSQPTVRDYFEIAAGTFIWRQVPPYEKKALKRIVKHPKGFMRDTGLLHHLLRIRDMDTLISHPRMGHSWEGMVIEEILRGIACQGIPCDHFYYRTGAGAEIDLLLEGDFGLLPIEIKYRQAVDGRELRSLHDFIEERKLQFGIVINNDDSLKQYSEKIIGVPFTAL